MPDESRSAEESPTGDRENGAVVIDVGTLSTKAGFSPDDCPRAIFPTFDPVRNRRQKDAKRSTESTTSERVRSLVHPIERGYITTQWESMEDVWHHAFYNELRVQPDSQPVVLTMPPMNPKATTERTAQILFDTFRVPSLYMNVSAVLALYASGRTTGCVVDSGHGVTHIVPIYEGYCLPVAIARINIAGSDVTEHLQGLLSEQWNSLSLPANAIDLSTLAADIKETLCYVATDLSAEMEKSDGALEKIFEIPKSDASLAIRKEAFLCTEILFEPNGFSEQECGIVQATYQSMEIASRGAEIFRELCANIVLTGGNTLFPGFRERFSKDVEELVPRCYKSKVIAPETRKFDVWRGGSILASLSTLDSTSMWLSREKFREKGASSVHRHFF